MNAKLNSIAVGLLLATAVTACNGKTVPSDPEQPVPAAPASVKLDEAKTNSLQFSWNAVDGAERYVARLEKADGTLVTDGQKPVTTTTITYSGLSKGTEYQFKVRAIAGGVSGEYSTPLKASTLTEKPHEDDNPGGDDNPEEDKPKYDYASFRISAEEDALGTALAFPGAQGGGMYTTGGRGGKVYHVTSLADDNTPGTLRWAVGQSGARTIVFDVAGIIELKSALGISKGDLTIAGQTAPGDGICLKNYTTQISCDNVIVRFIRFRLGDEGPNAGDSDDATWGRYHKNIILDHCSMSWSIDECASYYANNNMTMQWCLIAESMRNCCKHSKGNHGYGGIWGGCNASFHHNILAHHDSRNPRFDHPEIYSNIATQRGNVDYRNNLVYNWGNNSGYGGEGGSFNMVGNYNKPGPSSTDRAYILAANGLYASSKTAYGYPALYLSGNIHSKYPSLTDSDLIKWADGSGYKGYGVLLSAPLPIKGPDGQKVYVTTHSAADARDATCEWAGASLKRDAVDARVVAGVKDGTGKIINDIAEVKSLYGYAWPEYKATDAELSAVADTDGDGIPDSFERKFKLNPDDPADANAKTLDSKGRYTNLEMYLHYLVKDIVAEQNKGGNYTEN